MSRRPPRIGHVGLCVPDLDAAVAWYRDVLGLEVLGGPHELTTGVASSAETLRDVFGLAFRLARIAHLGLDGDAGLELFEFVEPSGRSAGAPSYFHHGISHLCFTVDDIDATVERIRAAGGVIRTRTWREHPDLPYRFVHFEDPFGNLLELHSHGNRETVIGTAAP